jgi:hypothetical protein
MKKRGGVFKMKILFHYGILILFVILTFFGLAIYFFLGSESSLWQLWQVIDVSFAVSLGVLAFLGYKEYMKSKDEIKIVFCVDSHEIDTGLSLLRGGFSRSEVLGILGMLQRHPRQRFDLHASRERHFLESIQAVQRGKMNRFVIPMSAAEFAQFEVL